MTPEALGLLQWRSRRGLLENDLLLQRFYQNQGMALEAEEAQAMHQLLDLADNDLLDILLGRVPPPLHLHQPATLALIQKIQGQQTRGDSLS